MSETRNWERWFAWYPVKAYHGGYADLWNWAWLCKISRIKVGSKYYYEWG